MKKILVIGAGAWGTAIANLLAKNSNQVFLNSNSAEVIDEINQKHSNENFLPDVKLDKKITAVSDYVTNVDFVFIVTPSSVATEVFKKISKTRFKEDCAFVICSKGLEQATHKLLSDAFKKITNNKVGYAVLAGPTFAAEVANEIPTIASIASSNRKLAARVMEVLDNNYFQTEFFRDPRTAELCSIVKNIIAIGCGIVDGLELGVNTKAALVMKGIYEIQTLCRKFKASCETTSAAGFGDIFLTCSSSKSRNNSLGQLIAQGKSPQKGVTYEGAVSAREVAQLAKKFKLKLDLCEEINEILQAKYSPQEIKEKIIKAILK